MAVNVKNLSPKALKELKSGDKITIRYARSQQEVDENASRIIYEGFPKNVATAFSSKWSGLFPAINKMTIAQLSAQQVCKAVTIVGGNVEDALAILRWMLSCCEGKGLVDFATPMDRPYLRYFMIKKFADIMSITVLSTEMTSRMDKIMKHQVHSEDIRAMYKLLPATDPLLAQVAAHIANLISKRNLKAFGAYEAVRRDIPAFDKAIEEILGPRKTKEQKAKDAVARQTRSSGPSKQSTYHYRWVPRPNAATNTIVPRIQPVEPPTQTKTIHCEVRRKGAKGRPKYVTLPLADIGVTRYDFAYNNAQSHGRGHGRGDDAAKKSGDVRAVKGLGSAAAATSASASGSGTGSGNAGASASAPDLLVSN